MKKFLLHYWSLFVTIYIPLTLSETYWWIWPITQRGSAVSSIMAARANTATPTGSPGTVGCSRNGLSHRRASNRDVPIPMGTLGGGCEGVGEERGWEVRDST